MRTHGAICIRMRILHICKICTRMQIAPCVQTFRCLRFSSPIPVFAVSDQVLHKPGSTTTQNRDLKFLIFSSGENKYGDQPRGYREADLRLCFRICKTIFSWRDSYCFIFILVIKLFANNGPNARPLYFCINVYWVTFHDSYDFRPKRLIWSVIKGIFFF